MPRSLREKKENWVLESEDQCGREGPWRDPLSQLAGRGTPRTRTFCLKTRRVADQTVTLGALTVPLSHFKVDADGKSSLEGVSESIRLSDGACGGKDGVVPTSFLKR